MGTLSKKKFSHTTSSQVKMCSDRKGCSVHASGMINTREDVSCFCRFCCPLCTVCAVDDRCDVMAWFLGWIYTMLIWEPIPDTPQMQAVIVMPNGQRQYAPQPQYGQAVPRGTQPTHTQPQHYHQPQSQ